MASDEIRVVLGTPLLFPKLVSVALARLTHTQEPTRSGFPRAKRRVPVDPSFSLSLLVSVQRTRAEALDDPFIPFLYVVPVCFVHKFSLSRRESFVFWRVESAIQVWCSSEGMLQW